MSKHTPGPWRRGRKHNSIVADSPATGIRGSDDVEAYGGHMICESVNEPNGQLIIAATEMLEALRDVQRYFDALDEMQPDRKNKRGTEGKRIREVVQDAIAKAKGETP